MSDILNKARIPKKIFLIIFVEPWTRSVSMDRESKCLTI